MANYIENQPVFLGTTDTCSNDVDFVYNQLVDITDTTQFQLSIAPCISAENLIVNPNFEDDSDWTLTGNVGIADNQLCFAGDTTTGDAAKDKAASTATGTTAAGGKASGATGAAKPAG